MRRPLSPTTFLLAVIVLAPIGFFATLSFAQRTAVSMLNSKTDITTAVAGNLLQGQSDGTWAQVPAATAVPASWLSSGAVNTSIVGAAGGGFYLWMYGDTTTAACFRVPVATTLDQMHCHLSTAPAAGQSVTVVLVKNGADQAAQSVTLGAGVTNQKDLTGTVAYVEDDAFCLHATVTTGGVALSSVLGCTFRES